MAGPDAEFWRELDLTKNALVRKTDEQYKNWLEIMFAGIACLAREHAERFRLTALETKRLEGFPAACKSQVAMVSPNLYKNRESRLLTTQKNFKYLVSVLRSDDPDVKWYLVSVAPWYRARSVELEFG